MRSSAQFLLLILVIGLSLWREAGEWPLLRVDEQFAGWVEANEHRPLTTGAPLALVEINDSTLQQSPWPWKPLDYTLFFQAVLPYQPSLIAIAPLLSWKETQGVPALSTQDAQMLPVLHDFILKAPKVLLAARLGRMEDTENLPPMQALPSLRHVEGDIAQLPVFNFVAAQPEESLRLAATAEGFTNLEPSGGKLAAMPLVFDYCGAVVPSFVLQAAMLALDVTPDDVRVRIGKEIDIGKSVRIPIDARGRMRVDFRQSVPQIGYDDFLLAVSREQAKIPSKVSPEILRGRVVLLVRTDRDAPQIRLMNGQTISRGAWIAAALATIQTHAFTHKASMAVSGLLIVLALAGGFFARRCSRARTFLIGLFALVVYLMISLAIFSKWSIMMPLVLPTGLAIFIVLYRFLSRSKLHVPAATVSETVPRVFSQKEPKRLEGEEKKPSATLSARFVMSMPSVGDVTKDIYWKETTIGWKNDNHIRIQDPSISGHHAVLLLTDGKYILKDLNSTNKTYVNGKAITEKQLANGDYVRFGSVDCAFKIGDASVPQFFMAIC